MSRATCSTIPKRRTCARECRAIVPARCSPSGSASRARRSMAARSRNGFARTKRSTRQIAERFGGLIEAGLAGELEPWSQHPESALAQIVVLDQFTRNVFRNSPRAFAGDARALAAARALVASGGDQRCCRCSDRSSTCRSSMPRTSMRRTKACGCTRCWLPTDPDMKGSLEWAHTPPGHHRALRTLSASQRMCSAGPRPPRRSHSCSSPARASETPAATGAAQGARHIRPISSSTTTTTSTTPRIPLGP